MAHMMGKRKRIGLIISAVLLLTAGLFAWTFGRPLETPAAPTPPPITTTTKANETASDEPAADTAELPAIQPEDVSTIAIEPLGVIVSYGKDIPGFSFSIHETGVGTKYAELYADQLVGTKCTDDTGVFALIVKDPQSQEDQTTLALTTTVEGTTYGLSLPSNTCTANAALFAEYQAAFHDAFGLLKAL